MGCAYKIDETMNFLVVRLWGERPEAGPRARSITSFGKAVSGPLGDKRIRPNPLTLVDRREARITVDPGEVSSMIDFVESRISIIGRPKVAVVVSADSDFGMLRMFEMRADDLLRHEFRVFSGVTEACAWLGVDADAISLPEP